MLPAYLLSLREGIEAALIIGIVLSALRKINRVELIPALWLGSFSAIAVSILSAVVLTSLGLAMQGPAEVVFEGGTMLVAASILTWMIFWMNRQARTLKSDIEASVGKAVAASGRRAVFGLAFLAVVREGVELALFLTASVFATNAMQTTIGAILGLGTAILLGWMIVASTVRLNMQRFFQVTGFLLILFAAGLVAQGIREFNEINWIPPLIAHLWDVNTFISNDSTLGQLLKALFGYNGNPSLTEMLGYFGYLAVVALFLRGGRKKSQEPLTLTQA
jgi:high-affinity iron transporter